MKGTFSKRFENFPNNKRFRDPFLFDILNSNVFLNQKVHITVLSNDETFKRPKILHNTKGSEIKIVCPTLSFDIHINFFILDVFFFENFSK